MKTLAALLLTAGLLSSGTSTAQPDSHKAAGPFRIDKIRYQQGQTLNSEYVVVKNVTGHRHDLEGFQILDPLDGQAYTFPTTMLRPGTSVTLHTGVGANRAGHRYWRQSEPMWNNDGDTAVLKNTSGRQVDRCVYRGTEGGTADC